ncbi:MAG: T9SS type A sorting domain-containing protein [Bacteroidales bacterium]|jgi:hypothetical protein|nr:T9SS type A sorting domain-containing protein [Bacteroidales bacterium]
MFRLLVLLLVVFFVAEINTVEAQVMLKDERGRSLKNPWAGGLDAVQFGRMDLDGDGKSDLLVFDRRGNRFSCYLNKGAVGEINFEPTAAYNKYFPAFEEWVIFVDYDGDGFEDIFTYSKGWAGIKVYRHKGSFPPEFELVVSPYLTSLQGAGHVNILATNADYPAIIDIDGDGDLDLLSFWSLGTFIELHTNMSMEKYGHADSLDFERTDFCWGRVAENEETNEMYLDTCLFDKQFVKQQRQSRHRGATFGIRDLNNDGLPELLLADVDYPGITMFWNGGTIEEAFMVSQDTAFPSYSTPVRLFSMPLPYFTDVNNDGLEDMLVSPFDPNFEVTENKQSVWLYLNEGTAEIPDFRLFQKDFLQADMLDLGSGAFPLLADLDADGIADLIIGNIGSYQFSWYDGGTLFSRQRAQIDVYKAAVNNGNTVFSLETRDLAGLFAENLRGFAPAAADINGDGRMDLLIGNATGKLIYLEQQTDGTFMKMDDFFQQIDVGEWSAPQLFDLDKDGIVDLLIGNISGKISFYKGVQFGENIQFELVTDFLGEVNITDFNLSYAGYSTPHFFRMESDETLLLVGSEQGKLYLFENIDNNIDGIFQASSRFESIFGFPIQYANRGMRTAAIVVQTELRYNPGLMIGNFSGGLELFNREAEVFPAIAEQTRLFNFRISPNPTSEFLYVELPPESSNKLFYSVYSSSGQLLISASAKAGNQNKIALNISNLPVGIYRLQLIDGDKMDSQAFIKTN